MEKGKILERVCEIKSNFREYYINNFNFYKITTQYKENDLFKYNNDLYLVLNDIWGIIPSPMYDLKLYCKIPKSADELDELIARLGYNWIQVSENGLKYVVCKPKEVN